MNRREFLAAGVAAVAVARTGQAAWGQTPRPAVASPDRRKLVLVLFGGGVRSSETIDDPAHRHIPNLWQSLVPRGTLWTNMRVEGPVVHPNGCASIKTGHWEYADLDWAKPPRHPTVFEIVRRRRDLPDTGAWTFVYASILANTGESTAVGYGARWGANVVEPPTIPRHAAEEMDRLLAPARATGSSEAEWEALAQCARIARRASRIATKGLRSQAARRWLDEQYARWLDASGTTSHDAFLTDCARACMEHFAPDVLSVDYGEIDCAHYGSWSRYVEAIRRTDALVWRLWQAAESLASYQGRTVFLILPDHGRQLEGPTGPGFLHHSDFYTGEGADEGCRRVWMLAVGAGVEPGRIVHRPTPITSAATTGLELLGLSPG
jgi:hypothetical protein